MTYLAPNEFWVGAVSSLSELALVFPRNAWEKTFLVSKEEDGCWATFLDPSSYQYHSFPISGDEDNRIGLIVPAIKIEVDQASVFDPNQQMTFGTMIRDKDRLSILANARIGNGVTKARNIQIKNGLLSCDDQASAGYKKWRIVLGEGELQRVLWDVDVSR